MIEPEQYDKPCQRQIMTNERRLNEYYLVVIKFETAVRRSFSGSMSKANQLEPNDIMEASVSFLKWDVVS